MKSRKLASGTVLVFDTGDEVVDEQVEVVSLTGDIALDDGSPKVHAHVVMGNLVQR